ncbi:MAG: diphosphate--fructose-6-phosphate 1-phosphotransferase [Chlamydiales bacterium]|nr:diphosphate--fructose-6-phosphate 1-phosphotransferase [Chlamydiales bacterium]
MKSPIEEERLNYQPRLPHSLRDLSSLDIIEGAATEAKGRTEKIKELLPKIYGGRIVTFKEGKTKSHAALRVGVVLSGGQAAGGHNVITGLFDALKKMNPSCRLFGFLNGPSGIVENRTIEITQEILVGYRNTGGFDLIGSGRTKIESPEQLEAARKNVESLALNGLVIIGGDDSNTNAALLAEYFASHGCHTHVIGVPKTIDGDLKNAQVEISFGFDTACKTYAEIIGNIARDAVSAKKYYHFIKLMGRSASHITLECALQTHPNIALIGEEVAARNMTLEQITEQIADVVCKRAKENKNYGVVLIPEGLIEFLPEMKQLIGELNKMMAKDVEDALSGLSERARETFDYLPKQIAEQLLLDRDPHGNVQVSHISTENLLIHTVKHLLEGRGDYKGKFNPVNHFLGYEGRSCFPSNFDADYCYSLGFAAAILIDSGRTGYMSVVHNLAKPVEEWEVGGIPITMLMNMEERKGKLKPVIEKALVDLDGEPYRLFVHYRDSWSLEDQYCYPGPIQFFGPSSLTDLTTYTLKLEQHVELCI